MTKCKNPAKSPNVKLPVTIPATRYGQTRRAEAVSILVEEVEPVLGALEFAGAIAMIRSGLGPETVHWTTIG
ncbi:MAG: hypothetical protein DMG77_07145 [Acidobacteria bacterium]|nr:MAG: hypothetical protein DMG77_07145 [Acidobacteriota bacterium]